MRLMRHLRSLLDAFRRLIHQPFGSLMTLSVLAIALALPSGFYLLVKNAGHLFSAWEEQAQVSLFLRDWTTSDQARAMQADLRRRPGIREVRYIDKQAALAEFQQISGYAEALEALEGNPLPASLVVGIDPTYYRPDQIRNLVKTWSADPRVDLAQYDLNWVARLQALLDLVMRAVWLFAGLLALGVMLIIGNTIRLSILSRQEEIAISRLLGASNGFIRLPFIYHGLVQGALAGLLAWGMVAIGIALLQAPTTALANLYGEIFRLRYLPPEEGALLVAAGALLGLSGALLATQRHLRRAQ
ncbi:permease-like cell division protein FtsX [Thermithiobacillus plumbiphilus]|uniref:Cell division protein FtsX n=1 Tax=Thermithiobacillus plumbiphilus TaxID=1729899 RepID=A0ABU9DAQ8_9PROT